MNEFLSAHIGTVGAFVGILLGTSIVAYIMDGVSKRFIEKATKLIKGDPIHYHFLRHFLSGVIYVIGISWAISAVPSLKAIATSLLGAAGILAIAIGLASQNALSNIVSGIFIVIFKPFSINDRLRIRDNTLSGVVEDITLRHTVIRDFENRRIIIPNSVINQEIIINADFGDDKICTWFEIAVDTNTNIDLAKDILCEEALKHPLRVDNRKHEEIVNGKSEITVKVLRVNEYGIRLRAWIWAKDSADAFNISCDMYESVKKRFDEVGISIPQVPKLKVPGTEEL
ncbi:mechanosensitive ion channel family protein [Haliscomenobacter hydrossis]|uniref:MscS Mechanosensitive ion channel n=1 Tax=Haliscomenobacter hydrossis (strain ATCC 27775 / DSM 1100 / LMG 10767 / O) TaxID=760192 RepID=F4L2C6_HALH1|nr:mechanosensitive ion channel family protein [Haliscomenobacter hydrossis]AEE52879.1 MscS Mechanosensitive ion channel [Haliscomenobacter hydrossis DSM 1100]